jgi:predicted RNA-binding Zn-ribbon protein involved in translation (DUF1610 family)
MPDNRRHDMGPGGNCVCPKCNKEIPHQKGTPCMELKCPECGAKMLRKDSFHHQKVQEKKKK